VPRLGRWNFFDPAGNWRDIPLGERMPVFTRHQNSYWSPDDYVTHASTGQASPTGSDTWRRPREGTALYEHMLAATPDAVVEGYRRGAERALETIGKRRDETMLLYWGFSTGGPFLWALNRFLTADGMMGWATSNTGISYYYGRTTTGNYDWGYEDSVLRVRERGRPDFRFYTEHLSEDLREKLWQEALQAPNFKSVEDTSMFFNVAALAEQASRLWHAGFLPPDEIETGYAALVQQVMEPCFPAPQLRDVAVWEMNGTLDQVIQPWKVDAARAVMEQYCKRYRVARLEDFRHDIMHDTIRVIGQIWLTVIETGYFD
jgi:hypothetical protein